MSRAPAVARRRGPEQGRVPKMSDALKTADIDLIQRIIPHRYPFLLIDRVIEVEGYQHHDPIDYPFAV